MQISPAVRGRTFRIRFDGFAALVGSNPMKTVGILEPVAVRMAGAILTEMAHGQDLLYSEASEVSTLGSSEWPRYLERSITISAQEEPGSIALELCRVALRYDYLNPRDGDAWTMLLIFRGAGDTPYPLFTLSSHSFHNGNHMALYCHDPADGIRDSVEGVLRRFFGEDRRFYE